MPLTRYHSQIISTRTKGFAVLRLLTPSPFLSQIDHGLHLRRDSNWVDGLRGVAALCVYIFHFLLPVYSDLRNGYSSGRVTLIFRLPVLRIIYSAATWVSIFFLLSGYTLGINPWTLSRRHGNDRAFAAISSSCTRRPVRLFGPPIMSTFLVMLATQLGAFERGHIEGIITLRPILQSSLWSQYLDWSQFVWAWLLDVWNWDSKNPSSNYGGHLWTVAIIMKGSLVVYLLLFVLVPLRPRMRPFILLAFILYCYCWSRHHVALFATGVLFAEIESEKNVSSIACETLKHHNTFKSVAMMAFWILCLVLGLYIGSFPENGASALDGFPMDPFGRTWRWMWYTAGATLITAPIPRLPWLLKVLESDAPQYLGKISFSLYIVHEPLLQIFGWKLTHSVRIMLKRSSGMVDELAVLLVWLLVTLIILACADVFWQHVERPSTDFAQWLESMCYRDHAVNSITQARDSCNLSLHTLENLEREARTDVPIDPLMSSPIRPKTTLSLKNKAFRYTAATMVLLLSIGGLVNLFCDGPSRFA